MIRKYPAPLNVIRMLMGQKKCFDAGRFNIALTHTPFQFFPGKTGIQQNVTFRTVDDGCIPVASAAQNGEPENRICRCMISLFGCLHCYLRCLLNYIIYKPCR